MQLRGLKTFWLGASILALLNGGCSKPAGEPGGAATPAAQAPATMTLPANTVLRVTVDETLASNRNHDGDSFAASLAEPLLVNGVTVFPQGVRAAGRVVAARESGRLHGVASLAVALTSLEVNGQSFDIETNTYHLVAKSHNKRNLGFIGGGGAAGALIGGLAGGGKGALIGGAIGAGAGTAGAAATGKKDVAIPAESRLRFHLLRPVTIPAGG